MPKKNETRFNLLSHLKIPAVRTGPVIAALTAFAITLIVVLVTHGNASFNISEFEAGKVADRDIIASEPVALIDHEATEIQTNTRLKLVPAVWKYDTAISDKARIAYESFASVSMELFRANASLEYYIIQINQNFPAVFDRTALAILYNDPDRENSLEAGRRKLEFFIERGIFALSESMKENELAAYNSDIAELLHNYGNRIEREQITYDRIITKDNLDAHIVRYIEDEKLSRYFTSGAGSIIGSLLEDNVFFSPSDTEQRSREVRSMLEPVYRTIERGDRVIRQGFVITEKDMENLIALNIALTRRDPRNVAGQILLLLVIYLLFVFHMGERTLGRTLRPSECYMMTVLAAAYIIGSLLANTFVRITGNFPVSILIPTSLMVMLPAILLGYSMALITAILLPLGAFLTGAFDISAYIFALCSGIAASHALKVAQKRMDLVKAGIIISTANAGAALIIMLLNSASGIEAAQVIFWAAFNGLVSGLLVIGILPIMEQALNAATPFRLIELSDLNSPILKRLFNAAPGTYSHSIMVANLAETACQDIGANALLARVGAYYHDIGKMEQPSYFVENQTSYNKHTDISPRLSATVIRSHVKLGVEKALSLRLPEALIAIISEHHGNSVITWFYNEALKREKNVNIDDFTYPGSPPRSKESAVVMLADITEAATRVLKKPTAARMEKFIQELISNKVEHGQLAHSELTFRELEIIKQAFVKVLVSHYHSRIEYPKITDNSKDNSTKENNEQN